MFVRVQNKGTTTLLIVRTEGDQFLRTGRFLVAIPELRTGEPVKWHMALLLISKIPGEL